MIRKIKKKSAKESSALKKKLDTVFSQYIRLRDMIPNTTCFRCISCGMIYTIGNADCGHYINRQHMITRFSEINCNAQCRSCNRFDEGNMSGYRKGLILKYGESKVLYLESLKRESRKYTEFEYKGLIEHYKKEVKRILNERGLSISCLTK